MSTSALSERSVFQGVRFESSSASTQFSGAFESKNFAALVRWGVGRPEGTQATEVEYEKLTRKIK